MKKTSIKVFGVCAATLLTLGAVAPVAVHAEEVTATNELIQERDVFTTVNNLKREAKLTPSQVTKLMEQLKPIYAASITDNTVLPQQGIGAEDITTDPVNYIFDQNIVSGRNAIRANLGMTYVSSDEMKMIDDATSSYHMYALTDAPADEYANVGNEFHITFWTNINAANPENPTQYSKVKDATVKIKVVDVAETADYSVNAGNINAEIGDLYNPTQNVTVNNEKDGYTINNAVVIFKEKVGTESKYAFFGRDNIIKGHKDEPKELLTLITDEFNYDDGTFYLIEDTSDFATPARIKTETISVGNNSKRVFEYYNSDVKNFNQTLKIMIPNDVNDDFESTLYTSRLINVTGETEGETPEETKVPVYRAYNPNNGDHLFTTSLKEYNEVVDKGWAPEGLAWNAATEEDGTKPVYRLYNPNSGEHFYTDSEKEYNEVAAAGWNKEGIAFYSAASEDGVKIFRSFNPNATGPGSHMFTDSEKEYNELTAAGWSPEGVAFYGIK